MLWNFEWNIPQMQVWAVKLLVQPLIWWCFAMDFICTYCSISHTMICLVIMWQHDVWISRPNHHWWVMNHTTCFYHLEQGRILWWWCDSNARKIDHHNMTAWGSRNDYFTSKQKYSHTTCHDYILKGILWVFFLYAAENV